MTDIIVAAASGGAIPHDGHSCCRKERCDVAQDHEDGEYFG
ncbi:hypothetical protein P8T85_10875 [Corynebacterium rouxii]|nr:hypothetical protein [Corynebacterium rouxii]MDT9409679.1 hypothetical protein [Corynebacterium rouxii]